MNTTQTTVDVKRFLKEKIRDELVPALEQLVDELPENLVGFSDAEQLLRGQFLKLAGGMLQNWTDVAMTRISIPRCPTCGHINRIEDLRRDTIRDLPPQQRLSALPVSSGVPGQIAVTCCDGAMIHAGSKPKYLKNKADTSTSRKFHPGRLGTRGPGR